MENSNPEFVTAVANKEQIRDLYPGMFEDILLEETSLYVEKPKEGEGLLDENRTFLFGSGVLAVSTLDLEYLWNMSLKDNGPLLHELSKYSAAKSVRRADIKSFPDFESRMIEGSEFGLYYYAYKDVESSEKLLELLEKKARK